MNKELSTSSRTKYMIEIMFPNILKRTKRFTSFITLRINQNLYIYIDQYAIIGHIYHKFFSF